MGARTQATMPISGIRDRNSDTEPERGPDHRSVVAHDQDRRRRRWHERGDLAPGRGRRAPGRAPARRLPRGCAAGQRRPAAIPNRRPSALPAAAGCAAGASGRRRATVSWVRTSVSCWSAGVAMRGSLPRAHCWASRTRAAAHTVAAIIRAPNSIRIEKPGGLHRHPRRLPGQRPVAQPHVLGDVEPADESHDESHDRDHEEPDDRGDATDQDGPPGNAGGRQRLVRKQVLEHLAQRR